jgi:hypothetical protein
MLKKTNMSEAIPGRAIRHLRAELDAYMAAQLVHSTSEKRVVTGSANTAHISRRQP